MPRRFLITGCGRSGTLYTSQLLTAAGVACGHESACRVSGFKGMGDLVGEASWYAAAYLEDLPDDVVVIHQVRQPLAVASSWYRIRLFARTPLITVCYGQVTSRQLVHVASTPRATSRRWQYIRQQRQLVGRSTSAFDVPGEAERCLRYWGDWNRLTEEASRGRPYMRFRLENLGPQVWKEIGDFVEADLGPLPDLAPVNGRKFKLPTDQGFEKEFSDPANRKPRYPPRPFPPIAIPESVRSLAEEYGYHLTGEDGSQEGGAERRTQASIDACVHS